MDDRQAGELKAASPYTGRAISLQGAVSNYLYRITYIELLISNYLYIYLYIIGFEFRIRIRLDFTLHRSQIARPITHSCLPQQQ